MSCYDITELDRAGHVIFELRLQPTLVVLVRLQISQFGCLEQCANIFVLRVGLR